jgi:hypothetical protein
MASVRDTYKPLDNERADRVHGQVCFRCRHYVVRAKELPDGELSVRVHSRYDNVEKLPIGYFLGVNYLYTGEFEVR